MSLKIKIQIAGRYYPLSVAESDEQHIRSAGMEVEKLIDTLEKNYQIEDKQDALAMAALQLASQMQKIQTLQEQEEQILCERIKSISDLLYEDCQSRRST